MNSPNVKLVSKTNMDPELSFHVVKVAESLTVHGVAICTWRPVDVAREIAKWHARRLVMLSKLSVKLEDIETIDIRKGIPLLDGALAITHEPITPPPGCWLIVTLPPKTAMMKHARALNMIQHDKMYKVWSKMCTQAVARQPLADVIFGGYGYIPTDENAVAYIAKSGDGTYDEIAAALDEYYLANADSILLNAMNAVFSEKSVIIVSRNRALTTRLFELCHEMCRNEFKNSHISMIHAAQTPAERTANIHEFARGETKILVFDFIAGGERVPFNAANEIIS